MRSDGEGRPGSVVCSGGWRVARATTVSLVALGLAVGGHVYGGGSTPPWQVFAIVWAVAGGLSWSCSGHRWTSRELVAILLLVQAVMHMTCALGPAPETGAPGAVMLSGHALATAVSAAVLRYGEDAAWCLLDVLLLRPFAAVAASATVAAPWAASAIVRWPHACSNMARLLSRTIPLRGPPASA